MDRLVSLGVRKLSYSGGEPLLYPAMERSVKYANRCGLEQIVTTNGDALAGATPRWFDFLQYVKISFYGHGDTHDEMMGRGHYGRIMAAAKRLSSEGHSVGANYVLTSRSAGDLPDFLKHAVAAGVDRVLIMTYVESGDIALDEALVLDESARDGVRAMAARHGGAFSGGIKLHNYSKLDFYLVLNESDEFILPRSGGRPDFVMGGVFDQQLRMPGESMPRPAERAVLQIWARRSRTDAIVPLA